MSKKPGTSSGNQGGIYQEIGPRGGTRSNFTTVADNKPMPPTSTPGSTWKPIQITPNSNRNKN
jgi:hypothetical protein